MPKEKIEDSHDFTGFQVEVSWGFANVQLASVNPESPFFFGEDFEGDTKYRADGWRVTLDRKRINELIRVLRKARDRAFGADA